MIQHLNTTPFQIAVVVTHHNFEKRNTYSISFSNNFEKLQKRALPSNTSN